MNVRAGEILGLAGLVGAGRTELARILFGLTPADAGEIQLRGRPVAIDSPGRAVALGIAYVPEDRRRHGVILDMSTASNTTLATLRAISRLGFLDFGRERTVAAGFVRQLGIKTASLETPVANLSGGNQQKVALARWLAANPAVLILDEPTQGVDVGAKAEIHRLMSELAATRTGHSDDLLRAARDPRDERPDRRDARWYHRRSSGPCRRDSGSDPGASAGPCCRSRSDAMIERYRRELSVAIAYAALLLVLAFAAPRFFRPDPLRAFVVSNASVLVAAVGMTLVILCRQIDISIGSIFSICGVVAGLLARAGLPIALVGLGTIVAGGGMGAINGALVARLGLPSIVVTLATLVIGRESLRYVREGEFVRNLPPGFQWFGAGQAAGQWLVVSIALVVFALFAWGLRHLAAGRAVYATGSDPEAARLAGIRPRGVIFAVFVVMGALAGLAALLNAVRFARCRPQRRPRAGAPGHRRRRCGRRGGLRRPGHTRG